MSNQELITFSTDTIQDSAQNSPGDFEIASAAFERRDGSTAARIWRTLAEQGHAMAQHNLGLMYGRGLGVPQDYCEALTWFRLAAEQGRAGAQHNLGSMYANGLGVTQDHEEAVKWFRLADNQTNGTS